MLRRALFVLPKNNSYQYKELEEQSYIKSQVMRWKQLCDEAGIPVYCFSEDLLAVQLFGRDESVKWIKLLPMSDRLLIEVEEDCPDYWNDLEIATENADITQRSVKKYKVDPSLKKDLAGYAIGRKSVMRDRLRFAANEFIKEEKFIVFFKNNNGYCNVIESSSSDGKLLVVNDIVRCFETCELGGATIPSEMVPQILKAMGGAK